MGDTGVRERVLAVVVSGSLLPVSGSDAQALTPTRSNGP